MQSSFSVQSKSCSSCSRRSPFSIIIYFSNGLCRAQDEVCCSYYIFAQFSLRLLLRLMAFHVKRQMIRSGKSPVTELAFKRFGARVLSKMPGKLVRTSEPPFTAFPGTFIRFFARMSSHVSLEMRTLRVNFITTWMFTVMYPTSL